MSPASPEDGSFSPLVGYPHTQSLDAALGFVPQVDGNCFNSSFMEYPSYWWGNAEWQNVDEIGSSDEYDLSLIPAVELSVPVLQAVLESFLDQCNLEITVSTHAAIFDSFVISTAARSAFASCSRRLATSLQATDDVSWEEFDVTLGPSGSGCEQPRGAVHCTTCTGRRRSNSSSTRCSCTAHTPCLYIPSDCPSRPFHSFSSFWSLFSRLSRSTVMAQPVYDQHPLQTYFTGPHPVPLSSQTPSF